MGGLINNVINNALAVKRFAKGRMRMLLGFAQWVFVPPAILAANLGNLSYALRSD
jgi:hypothetical protein